MNTPPSIRDLAKASGLSRSTISAALNNRPNISDATKARVFKLAEEMGYRKDAKVSELMGYLSQPRDRKELLPIGWLYCNEDPQEWQRHIWRLPLFAGARDHAEKLGYRIEEFWLTAPGMTPKRMRNILQTRSVRGIILAPPFDAKAFSEFDYSGFSCAEVQNDPRNMNFHAALPDFTYNFDLAWDEAMKRGYKRPGFASIQEVASYQNEKRESRYFWKQQQLKPEQRLPIFTYRQKDPGLEESLLAWLHSMKPDVLFLNNMRIFNILNRAGLSFPQDLGLISLNCIREYPSQCSGIDQRSEEQGEAAVDILLGQFHRGETGIPATTRSIQIKGKWVDHGTA